jgi:UPF0716 protein FxsA
MGNKQVRRLVAIGFIVWPLAEIAGFIWVGRALGVWPTLALTLLSAALGTLLVRAQGFILLRRGVAALERGEPPVRELFEGVLLAAAGALLLLPGFFSDGLGLALLIPALRRLLIGFVLARTQARRRAQDGVIDGEWVEVVEPLPPPRRE